MDHYFFYNTVFLIIFLTFCSSDFFMTDFFFDFFIIIFLNDFFYIGLFYTALFYKHFFILITDKKSAEIEIALNICWFRYWAACVK